MNKQLLKALIKINSRNPSLRDNNNNFKVI